MTALRGACRFVADEHRYFIGQTEVPGTHAVMRAGGGDDGEPLEREHRWFHVEHRDRGKAVHAASLRFDLGDDWSLPAEWRGYMTAYVRLVDALRPAWTLLEEARFERRRRYATIIDRAGMSAALRCSIVLEIKTGDPDAFHGPQTAGQDLLLGGPRGKRRRFVGYLAADGRFRLREYDDPNDYAKFERALAEYWRAREAVTT